MSCVCTHVQHHWYAMGGKPSCCYHTLSLLVCAGSGSDCHTAAEDRHHQLGKSGPHTLSVE